MAHLSNAQHIAAELRALLECSQAFAASQTAWRFYANARVTLPHLATPLVESAKRGNSQASDEWALVALDWCLLHYGGHSSKTDRTALSHKKDLGYKLLTALAVSDRHGAPLAPVCLELRSERGVHTTRSATPLKPVSTLDTLEH
jgi:hypothetical protein